MTKRLKSIRPSASPLAPPPPPLVASTSSDRYRKPLYRRLRALPAVPELPDFGELRRRLRSRALVQRPPIPVAPRTPARPAPLTPDRAEFDHTTLSVHIHLVDSVRGPLSLADSSALVERQMRLLNELMRDHPLMQHPFRPRRLN